MSYIKLFSSGKEYFIYKVGDIYEVVIKSDEDICVIERSARRKVAISL